MAVRWGTGEEILTTCNMDIFPLDTLDETTGLNSGDTMNTLQGCLDPSILSMFEDPSAIEIRGLEEESEATLLTALTEILDNVDDENLSPFDTLPESDLLSGQKGREHSPLRRLFCLSRSPPEKETLFGKHRFTGKTLPMVQQRSDGEEEEDSLIPSPGRFELTSDNQLLDWEGLPITFEQNSDGLSVSLGDLVRQMHPYCMAISLEDNEGEQMLPEGGILLEVVDQGVNGEPILAIPEMDHTISVKLDESVSNSEVLDEDDGASDSSEQIVVDDDDDIVKPLLKVPVIKTDSNVKDKIIFGELEKKDEIKDKTPSRRKKKSSNHLAASPPEPSESRVLRSASLKKASHEAPKKYENKLLKKDKRQKQNKSKLEDPTATTITCVNPKHLTVNQTNLSEDTISATSTTLHISSEKTEMNQSVSPPVENVQQSESTQSPSVPASEQQTAAPTASKDVSVEAAATPEVFQSTTVVGAPGPLLSPVPAEPKPKALSLAEYRRLRQQKKPAPVEKQDDISTKWPSLPEPPRELPPIPHLPEPSPRDPRLSRAQSKEMEEVKPAWMPRGPGAPPTPEALLAPPAYMVNSVNKAATKPQQTPPLHASAPLIPTKEPTKGDPNSVTNYPSSSATTTTEEIKPVANVLTSVSKTVASSEIKPQINQTDETPKCSGSCGQSSSSPVTHLKVVNQSSSGKSEECPAVKPVEAKSPTQELTEAFSSEMGIEASDLTSLLEQFEETQAKEDQCLPEVSGRAVAVGNSSSIDFSDKMVVERIRTNDLSSTALTPPATPPHPLWKPLAPVSLLGKSKTTQTKSGSSRVIEIEAQPLPLTKAHNRLNTTASVDPDMACQDHDYCLPNKSTSCSEAAKRWNVKQHSLITIKPIKQTATPTLQNAQVPMIQPTTCKAKEQELGQKNANLETSSVLETPDASPTRDEDDNKTCPKRGQLVKSYRQRASSRTLSPKERSTGRSRVRRSHCSSSDSSESDSHSSRSRSRSYTPPRKRYRPCHSRSSSSSSSWSTSHSSSRSRSPPRQRRYSYSSSRSRSWSRSRSRSPQWSRKRHAYSPSYRDMYYTNVKSNPELKRLKEKAIEERRVVYVGRIRGTMTQKELKERFSYFGEIEECTLHFRDHGDNYGFVTYYNTNDAFMAIENGSKLRKPDEMPFDLCFGGRRQFCQTSYADLDSSKEYEPLLSRNKYHALDFDTLLKQAQQNLKR